MHKEMESSTLPEISQIYSDMSSLVFHLSHSAAEHRNKNEPQRAPTRSADFLFIVFYISD